MRAAVVAGMVGRRLCRGAVLQLVLPNNRLRRHHASAERAPDHVLDRTITIRFDSNVASGLPWKFQPEQNSIKVRIGEVATVHYKVINEAARPIAAQASYNVSPLTVGRLFQQDQLLLLYRAAPERRRNARDDRRVLR